MAPPSRLRQAGVAVVGRRAVDRDTAGGQGAAGPEDEHAGIDHRAAGIGVRALQGEEVMV